MLDRVPTKPNRYAVYDENHNFIRYEYHERADEPTQVGDALNKANLLPDAVAAALDLTGNPQVKDALALLSSAVNPLQHVWDKFSQSVQSTTNENDVFLLNASTQTETISISYGDGYYLDGSLCKITNPTTIQLSYSNYATYATALRDKYFVTQLYPSALYKGKSDCTLTRVNEYGRYRVRASTTQKIVVSETYEGKVTSYSADKYPSNGVVGNYHYAYIGRPPVMPTKIATGSYTGTGTYGSDNPNSLTFRFAPKLVIVLAKYKSSFPVVESYPLTMVYNNTISAGAYNSSSSSLDTTFMDNITWNANSISWYSAKDTQVQRNSSGTTYYYVAIG